MIERQPTPYDDRIYTADWRAWRDPEVPENFNPAEHLLARGQEISGAHGRAMIVDGQDISYGDLIAQVARAGAALSAAGVRAGERVLLFGTDSLEFLLVWLGSVRIGAIPVVVSDLYKTDDLGYFLADTGAATLFIDVEQMAKLCDLDGRLPASLSRAICRGVPDAVPAQIPVSQIADLLASAPEPGPAWLHHCDDVCYMFYSGGTTGKAKGITHLAHDFLIVPARHGAFWSYRAEDVVYASSRKYFTHGIWPGVLIPLAHGATVVIDRRGPSPDVVIELLDRHAVTKFITVPTILKNMIVHGRSMPDLPKLPALSLVISASEKISPEVFETFEKVFGQPILDSIGSSEITYEWISNRPEETRQGSLGKPVFGCEVRLVDAEGRDVTTPDTPGEAWIRSRTACFFYWRKYDKSRETFVGPWTRTGDNLMFDEDGFFWFAGRDNDVFKVRGLWVSPLEIEAAVSAHDAVLESAVVSFEDGDGLTQIRCFLVLDTAAQVPDQEALFAELAARVRPLGGYKVPQEFHILQALPRTTLMKIDRRRLREHPAEFLPG